MIDSAITPASPLVNEALMNRAEVSREASVGPLRPLLAVVALMAVLAVAGCGSSGGGTSSSASSTPASTATPTSGGSAAASGGSTVEIANFMFTPMTLTVSAGTTVTWKFDDSTPHTVAADDNSFMSPPMSKGQTYTHTFATAGTVKYHCSIHPFMTGVIVVK
jgi:plastocyanin